MKDLAKECRDDYIRSVHILHRHWSRQRLAESLGFTKSVVSHALYDRSKVRAARDKQIRRLRYGWKMPYRAITERWGYSKGTICRAVNRYEYTSKR